MKSSFHERNRRGCTQRPAPYPPLIAPRHVPQHARLEIVHINAVYSAIMEPLTPRQRQVLDFVERCCSETGSPPTLDEISGHFSFKSSNSARQHLRLIERKGYLRLRPGRARGIRLTPTCAPLQPVPLVPLVGRIAAGDPIAATQDIEAMIPIPGEIWRGDHLFALRVRGDSMTGVGIFDGDIAVVNAQPVAENGTIAAVVIGEDVTLKRFFRSDQGILLRAANDDHSDLAFDPHDSDNIRIAGVLVGTLRTF
ncbi:MAG: transcriptional repressor LexA [Gammaproteobacteria bacterium]|nr:transcriptional repressor LexA [Gammaproteobacteria bacterium]MYF29062.1 transcriptional repressor LexA [Gammaproteobacteria bacterium]MYK48346.1 transcriptional repressor LexA [Gammaproteobacteria bacterium]